TMTRSKGVRIAQEWNAFTTAMSPATGSFRLSARLRMRRAWSSFGIADSSHHQSTCSGTKWFIHHVMFASVGFSGTTSLTCKNLSLAEREPGIDSGLSRASLSGFVEPNISHAGEALAKEVLVSLHPGIHGCVRSGGVEHQP